MDERDPELDEVVEELSATLRELRRELHDRRRGPLRLPRPPTPRELLRFTDEYTIPALVAGLEAAIRALELLQGAIRLVDGRPPGRSATRSGLADVGRATIERLDDVLADLQDAFEGEPADPDARRLLGEARALRDELDDRLAAETDRSPERGMREVPVDVEGELQSIKERLDDEDT